MDLLDLREPVSAWTHGAGLLLSLPVTLLLLRRSWEEPYKGASLFVFGVSLAVCYGASALFHGVRVADRQLQVFRQMDHVGIFMLIAGTYTPIAWNLLRGRWRSTTLLCAWLAAFAGALLHVTVGILPIWLSTGLYLAMGWGAIFCYAELARTWSHRVLRPILIGGVLYSVGAVINLAQWPSPWKGVFESHEVFHLFVVAGSAAHVWFMMTVVLPARSEDPWSARNPGLFTGLVAPHWITKRVRLVPLLVRSRDGLRGVRPDLPRTTGGDGRTGLRESGLGPDRAS